MKFGLIILTLFFFQPFFVRASPGASDDSVDFRLMKIHGVHSHYNGPNCWSSTLYALGLKANWLYAHPDLFDETLKRFCRPLRTYESLNRFDVGVIKQKEGRHYVHVHAFLLDTEGFFWSKKDYRTQSTLQRVSELEAFGEYFKAGPECRRLNEIDSSLKKIENCTSFVSYFRCELHPQRLKKISTSIRQKLNLFESLLLKFLNEAPHDISFEQNEAMQKMIDEMEAHDNLSRWERAELTSAIYQWVAIRDRHVE